jgi:WD40 repeat protein
VEPGGPGPAERRPLVIAAVIGLVMAALVAGTLAWRAAGQADDDLAARGFRGEISEERAFRAIAFAPDGTRIFAATGTVVEVWHLATRRRTGQPFVGHNGNVTALAVNPNGRLLATVGDDNTTRLWDVTTRTETGAPIDTGLVVRPMALAFSRDGSMLAVSGDGGTALWDVGGRRLAGVLESASGAHAAVAFSPDGTRVAAGDINGGTVTIWDVATREQVGEPLGGHQGNAPVSALAYDTSGTWLADGSADKSSFVYNVNTREHSEFRQNEEPVHTVILTADARFLITASIQDVVIWDVPNVTQLGRPVVPDGSADVNDVALGPDGDTIAVIRDHRIQFWSLKAASQG